MRIYIAGKIGGTSDYLERFEKAEKLLSEFYEVVNPAKILDSLPKSTKYDVYIHTCLELLRSCDAIYLLDGWNESAGACLEHAYACAMEMFRYREGDI